MVIPLLRLQKLGPAPAPGEGFGSSRGDVPARGPWDGWHLDTQGDFQPPASPGGAAASAPPLPCSPCPEVGDVPSHGDGSVPHPPCPVPARKPMPTSSGDLRNEQTAPTKPKKVWVGMWVVAKGKAEASVTLAHRSGVHPETKDAAVGKIIQLSKQQSRLPGPFNSLASLSLAIKEKLMFDEHAAFGRRGRSPGNGCGSRRVFNGTAVTPGSLATDQMPRYFQKGTPKPGAKSPPQRPRPVGFY